MDRREERGHHVLPLPFAVSQVMSQGGRGALAGCALQGPNEDGQLGWL